MMPDWLLPLVVGAVIGKVVDLTVPPLVNRVKGWLRDLNHWRRCRMGARQKRAETISNWKAAPPDFLRRTVFRWYEADPQTWWSYLHRIHQHHRSRDVRTSVEELLWEGKPAPELRVGEKLKQGGHVLSIMSQEERYTEIRIDPSTTRSYTGYGHIVQVARGWCEQGPE